MVASLAIVVALVAGSTAVACSGPRVIDRGKLEQGILDQSHSGDVAIASVSCPGGRPLQEGDTFTCQATLDGGQTVTIDATQTNGDGDVTFTIREAVITGERFAGIEDDVISHEYGSVVTLACPDVIVVVDGDTFTCDGTDEQGHVRKVTFTAVHPHDGDFTHVVEGLPPPSTTSTSTTS